MKGLAKVARAGIATLLGASLLGGGLANAYAATTGISEASATSNRGYVFKDVYGSMFDGYAFMTNVADGASKPGGGSLFTHLRMVTPLSVTRFLHGTAISPRRGLI